MGIIILICYGVIILGIIGYCLINYGFTKDVLKNIIKKIIYFRGLFFLIFWQYVCFMMMSKANGTDKLVLLPFALCGFAATLTMYSKTRELGKKLSLIFFIGGFGFLIIMGLLFGQN